MLLRIICHGALGLACFMQTTTTTIRAKNDDVYTDNLGNIYTVRDEELIKFLPTGKKFAAYSNLRLGKITSVDVTNPLKIVVYYQDFQQIVFLDNQLSANSDPVSLEKMGYQQAGLVAASSNNSVWIYDKLNNELVRFDETSKKTAATGNLKQVLGENINPTSMREFNGHLFMNDTAAGLYIFDLFGTFSRMLPLRKVKEFVATGSEVIFHRDSTLCTYSTITLEEHCRAAGFPAARVRIGQKKVVYAFSDSVIVRTAD